MDKNLEFLGQPDKIIELDAGEVLFRQGSTASHIYYVEKGRVRLLRYLSSGDPVSLYTAFPGGGLAEAAIFSEVYHCEARAIRPSRLRAYDCGNVRKRFAADPDGLESYAKLLSGQVRAARTMIEIRNIKSARERLLTWLRLYAGDKDYTEPQQSWTEIAEEIGLSRETVYRALARLAKQGRIERRGRQVRLLNQARRD